MLDHDVAAAPAPGEAALRRQAEIGGHGLRERVASGTIVNTLYLLSMNGLTIVQALLLARVLGTRDYGVVGLLVISFATLFALAAVGFDDKYIQQDHPDQQAAFEIAFTLQAMLCGLFTAIAFVAIPLFSALYDEPRILVPGLVLAAGMPLIALQTPIWVYYRRMSFGRQRLLESVNPAVSFVVTVSLALAGLGFWSVVVGTVVGSVVASAAAVLASPYRLRLRFEPGALREYTSFSWPLLLGSASGVVTFQVPITLAARSLGSAAIGAITLAAQISQFTRRVDDIVTHALYPAICAVKDQRQVLFEAFSKSNRLAVLWGFPVGVAVALFAPQAVPIVLGTGWTPAVPLVQILGLSAAVDQIGFNWTAFARARGETRILAVASLTLLVTVLGVGVPMLLAHGVTGLGVGLAAGTLATLVVRLVYLTRLFPAARMAAHVASGLAPTLPAAALVLAERAVLGGDGSAQRMLVEGAGYVVVVAGASWIVDRALLREALGYLRRSAWPQRARRNVDQADPATRLA